MSENYWKKFFVLLIKQRRILILHLICNSSGEPVFVYRKVTIEILNTTFSTFFDFWNVDISAVSRSLCPLPISLSSTFARLLVVTDSENTDFSIVFVDCCASRIF